MLHGRASHGLTGRKSGHTLPVDEDGLVVFTGVIVILVYLLVSVSTFHLSQLLTMHSDFIASRSRDLLSTKLLALEGTGPSAPLTRFSSTVSITKSANSSIGSFLMSSRSRIRERDSKGLNQVTTTGSHSRP